jgi:hypothetical protein
VKKLARTPAACALQHGLGLGGLGGEHQLLWHARVFAALLVSGPLAAEVVGAVNDGVATVGGVGEVDGDLAQPDPAERAGVLVGGADRVGGGLRVAGLVRDQHRVAVVQRGDRPGGGRVQYCPVVPAGAGEQVLQAVRAGTSSASPGGENCWPQHP